MVLVTILTHFCPPLRSTFAVRETAPLKPLRDDSALRALSSLRGLRGAPAVPPLCRETQSRTANVERNGGHKWVKLRIVRLKLRTHVASSLDRTLYTCLPNVFRQG